MRTAVSPFEQTKYEWANNTGKNHKNKHAGIMVASTIVYTNIHKTL